MKQYVKNYAKYGIEQRIVCRIISVANIISSLKFAKHQNYIT